MNMYLLDPKNCRALGDSPLCLAKAMYIDLIQNIVR